MRCAFLWFVLGVGKGMEVGMLVGRDIALVVGKREGGEICARYCDKLEMDG